MYWCVQFEIIISKNFTKNLFLLNLSFYFFYSVWNNHFTKKLFSIEMEISKSVQDVIGFFIIFFILQHLSWWLDGLCKNFTSIIYRITNISKILIWVFVLIGISLIFHYLSCLKNKFLTENFPTLDKSLFFLPYFQKITLNILITV